MYTHADIIKHIVKTVWNNDGGQTSLKMARNVIRGEWCSRACCICPISNFLNKPPFNPPCRLLKHPSTRAQHLYRRRNTLQRRRKSHRLLILSSATPPIFAAAGNLSSSEWTWTTCSQLQAESAGLSANFLWSNGFTKCLFARGGGPQLRLRLQYWYNARLSRLFSCFIASDPSLLRTKYVSQLCAYPGMFWLI